MLGAIRPTGSGGGGAVASVFGRSGAVVAGTNDYSASQIAGFGGSAAAIVMTPGTTQTLTAASSIAPSAGIIPITSTSPITLTSNPQITAGTNGQRTTVVNVGTNAITLVNGSGLIIGQNHIMYGGRAIGLIYLSTYSSWVLDEMIPESLALTGVPTAPTAAWNANSTQIATTAQVFDHLYNHDAPGWRNLSLTANWSSFGAPFAVPAVKRVGRDLISIRGVVVVAGSYAATIATLPVDCRPSSSFNVPIFSSAGIGQITIASSGVITNATTLSVGQFQHIQCSFSL
jgi:hypothetical protein